MLTVNRTINSADFFRTVDMTSFKGEKCLKS